MNITWKNDTIYSGDNTSMYTGRIDGLKLDGLSFYFVISRMGRKWELWHAGQYDGKFSTLRQAQAEAAKLVETIRSQEHKHDMTERGMANTCDYGCKVFMCTCGEKEIRHMASYGCRIGHALNENAKAVTEMKRLQEECQS